jgi:hypothetical protein
MRKLIAIPLIALFTYLTVFIQPAPQAATVNPQKKVVRVEQKRESKKAALNRLLSTPKGRRAFHKYIVGIYFARWVEYLKRVEQNARMACGGDLPDCYIVQRESHFNPCAVNPGHQGDRSCTGGVHDPGNPWTHASGKFQFMPGTWNNYRGYPYAAAAPVSVQNAKAREVWANGAGASHWACC